MIEISTDKTKITMEGKDLVAFKDVCNAAALAIVFVKAIGNKTSCGALSKDNMEWIDRTDAFLSELKGRAFLLEVAQAKGRE